MPRRICISIALIVLFACTADAADKPEANKSGTLVDQGTFAVFQNGRRVATEEFTVRQFASSSVTAAHLRLDTSNPADGSKQGGTLEQYSELTLLPDGSLSRYEWKQIAPAARSAVVEPNTDVLVLHAFANGKKNDTTFFLKPSTFVLDDYVFSSREVLLWRYLASFCQARAGGEGCDYVRGRFPILIPLRAASDQVYIEFKGYADTPLNGRPQHLRQFVMQIDGADWKMWLDEDQKLQRISVPSAATEVLRQ